MISRIVQVCITLIQVFLGSASIYSLLSDAVTLGLTFMFVLYLVGFVELELTQMKRIKKKAGDEDAD